jgi:hypothetical protein
MDIWEKLLTKAGIPEGFGEMLEHMAAHHPDAQSTDECHCGEEGRTSE